MLEIDEQIKVNEDLQNKLDQCQMFVQESLKQNDSRGEVMKSKKVIMKGMKDLTEKYKPPQSPTLKLPKFFPAGRISDQEFGELYSHEQTISRELHCHW